jgi:hypothetical protein
MSRLLPTNQLATWNRRAQFTVVLLCALALKLYYSAASANQLRWILAPTTALVELVSGASFEFEANAGYLSGDRKFLIAASCAGVNFLITAFLMLALRKLWRDQNPNRTIDSATSRGSAKSIDIDTANSTLSTASLLNRFSLRAWSFIPLAALFAYLATLVANTARISIALWLRRLPLGTGWLSAGQLHRLEGIFVYFGFLLLLFLISEKLSSRSQPSAASLESDSQFSPHARRSREGAGDALDARRPRGDFSFPLRAGRLHDGPSLLRRSLFPLVIYYVTALGIPLANAVYHRRIAAADFWEHSLFVLLTPLALVLVLAAFRLYNSRRSWAKRVVGQFALRSWRNPMRPLR